MQLWRGSLQFVDLHVAGKNQIAEQAIELIDQLYQVERSHSALKNTNSYATQGQALLLTLCTAGYWLTAKRYPMVRRSQGTG